MAMAQDFLEGVGRYGRQGEEALRQAIEASLGGAERLYRGAYTTGAGAGGAVRRGYEEAGAPAPSEDPGIEEALAQPSRAPVPPTPPAQLPVTPATAIPGPGWELPPQQVPGQVEGPGARTVGDEFAELEAAEMEALKRSLKFQWANEAEIDPRTGRPSQPREVFLEDTGAPLAASRRPGTGYTPPKESRGGNVSTMAHSEEGQFGADTKTMSPTQLRAHLESLAAQGEAQRLEIMAEDPYAAERAKYRAKAGGQIAVERGKVGARAEAEQQAQKRFMGEVVAAQGFLESELDDMEAQAAAEKWPEEERANAEIQIRDEAKRYLDALQLSAGMARRTISSRDDF